MKKFCTSVVVTLIILFAFQYYIIPVPLVFAQTSYVASCGNLNQPNTTYILNNDVSSEGTCFTIMADGITLDLNGHTVTYDTYSKAGITNADFELGSASIPSEWDLSQAPTAQRRSNSVVPMINQWHLYLDNAPDGTKIVSSWAYLPPKTKAISSFSRGDRTWAYTTAPLFNITVEFEDGSVVFTKDFTAENRFEFTAKPTEGRYRAILTLVNGYGLQLQAYGRYPTFDLFDIRPAHNYGVDASFRKNITIKNGKIIQGAAKGAVSHSVSILGVTAATVSDVHIETSGLESASIYAAYASGATIKNSTILNTSLDVFNRQQLSAAVSVGNGSNSLITNNTMECGPGWGCILGDNGGSEISYNNLKTNSVVTNHHAIVYYGSKNTKIHHNTIEADPGQGIILSKSTDSEVNNNTITIKSSANNYEYDNISLDAIRINDYANTGTYPCSNLSVHDNNIFLFGDVQPLFKGQTGHYINGIANICSYGNAVFSNNRITARSVDPNVMIGGIEPGGKTDYEVIYRNNTITSDMHNVTFGGYAGGGDIQGNVKFFSNTFIKGTNPTNYHTLGQIRAGKILSEGYRFIDTTLQGGAVLSDVVSGNYQYKYYADWYLNILVKGQDGNPISNASVALQDKTSATVFSGQTNSSGRIDKITLSEFQQSNWNYVKTITYYTPHTVKIIPPGNPEATYSFAMDKSKNLTYQIGSGFTIEATIPPPGTTPLAPPRGLRISP
jgi:hypothetical protein